MLGSDITKKEEPTVSSEPEQPVVDDVVEYIADGDAK
jgi:hypothetical protein